MRLLLEEHEPRDVILAQHQIGCRVFDARANVSG